MCLAKLPTNSYKINVAGKTRSTKNQIYIMKISLIHEEFTPHEMQLLQRFNGKILDSIEINNYEMYLISMKHPMYPKDLQLQLAIQQTGKSIWSPQDQTEKTKFNPRNAIVIKPLLSKLNEWLSNYKSISIASLNQNKASQWARLLQRFGYNIASKSFHGMDYYMVSNNQT